MSSFTQFDATMQVMYDREASDVLGADHWRVCEPFRFYLNSRDSGEWVYVPAGYLTDGASVPRVFWSFIPPWGQHGQAAVVHDIVCEYLSITKDRMPHTVTREQCDLILLEAMTALDVPGVKRRAVYQAVSLYRRLSGADKPTNNSLKRALEARWRSVDVLTAQA